MKNRIKRIFLMIISFILLFNGIGFLLSLIALSFNQKFANVCQIENGIRITPKLFGTGNNICSPEDAFKYPLDYIGIHAINFLPIILAILAVVFIFKVLLPNKT